MAVNPIARSYWNLIKANRRTFDSVPDSVKNDVIILAKQDVDNGIITSEKYTELTGDVYVIEKAEVFETPEEEVIEEVVGEVIEEVETPVDTLV